MIYVNGETVSYTGNTKELMVEMSVALAKVTECCGALICMGSVAQMTRKDCEEIIFQHVLDDAKARLEQLHKE